MKIITRKIGIMLSIVAVVGMLVLETCTAAISYGQNQRLITKDSLGPTGAESYVEVYGTGGGGTVTCTTSEEGYRVYEAAATTNWAFVGWSSYCEANAQGGDNLKIGATDNWLLSKSSDVTQEFDYTENIIRVNYGEGAAVQIFAVFKPIIKVTTDANGMTTNDENSLAAYGERHYVTFKPKTLGYEVDTILVDGTTYVDISDVYRNEFIYVFMDVTGPHTIHATFRPVVYKFEFNGNGNTSGNMSIQEFSYGTAGNLTKNTFVKNGYVFTGWNTAADGTGNAYVDEAQISNLTTESGKVYTLYAQWTPAPLTGTIEVTGEKIVGRTLTATLGSSNNTGTLTYKWQRNGVDISQANAATYVLTEEDVGATLTVIATSSEQTGTITKNVTDITDKLNVEFALTNITSNGVAEATYLNEYSMVLSVERGYKLPDTVVVTVDGTILTEDEYDYDASTGNLTIPAEQVTGHIKITAEGTALSKYTLTIKDAEHVTLSLTGTQEVYEGENVSIKIDVEKGYTLKSIKLNGVEQSLKLENGYFNINNVQADAVLEILTEKVTSNPNTGDSLQVMMFVLVIALIGIYVTTKLKSSVNEKKI